MMPVLENLGGGTFSFWCPGCNTYHAFDRRWQFNGDMEHPTFFPSLLVGPYWTIPKEWNPEQAPKNEDGSYRTDSNGKIVGAKEIRCHSFVRNGMIEYLSDCTHVLAGKTIPMIPVEEV